MVLSFNDQPLMEPYTLYIQDVTFERFMEFANEDISCELIDGVLVIHSPASFIHETIFSFLLSLLREYGKLHDLGSPVGSRFVMKISNKWAPEPDIMFIPKGEEDKAKDTFFSAPAPVVFEILSKSTRQDDLEKKLPKYLESGVKEVWIIDSASRMVSIHHPEREEKTGRFSGEDWAISREIDGFKLRVDWLWKAGDLSISEILDFLSEGKF